MEAAWSAVWAYGLDLALPLVGAIASMVSWARHRRRADFAREQDAGGEVAPALGQRIVRGTVAETEGGPGVRVTITQSGTSSRDDGVSTTTWRETGRET